MPPRWKTLLLACMLGSAGAAMASAAMAQASSPSFPSPDYVPVVPKAAFPEPLAERGDAARIVPERTAGATAADRCLAQCQTAYANCQGQPHDMASCQSRTAPRGCGSLQDPARRNACIAQVQDCSVRGATDTCQSQRSRCLQTCGN